MKKSIWKKWWVWVVVLIVLGGIGKLFGDEETEIDISTPPVVQTESITEGATEDLKVIKKEESKEEVVKVEVNINEIINKSEDEVNSKLGKPSSREEKEFRLSGTETKVPAVTLVYLDDSLEVMFIEGSPQRITYTPNEELKYPEDIEKAMAKLGFIDEEIGDQTDLVTVIELKGLYDARIFNNQGKVNYIYLIVSEKYK
jgi:hypothetical protein